MPSDHSSLGTIQGNILLYPEQKAPVFEELTQNHHVFYTLVDPPMGFVVKITTRTNSKSPFPCVEKDKKRNHSAKDVIKIDSGSSFSAET